MLNLSILEGVPTLREQLELLLSGQGLSTSDDLLRAIGLVSVEKVVSENNLMLGDKKSAEHLSALTMILERLAKLYQKSIKE